MDQTIATPATAELELQGNLDRQRRAFATTPFPTATQRRDSLSRLEQTVRRHQDAIVDAIGADFGNRSRVETLTSEILPTLGAAAYARRHVAGWMRPQRRAVGLNFKPGSNRVEYQPLGVVGVVSPWNYPIFLTLGPLIDILAAGNRAMIKPSELTPATAALLAQMIGEAFDPDEVRVVQGDVAVGRAFTALPFDHLIFTGSTNVGRDVMRAAAENLVPVTLELGGKSPVIVAEDFATAEAAQSVAVGKFFNAGQTCIAPDYALVQANRAEAFAHGVLEAAEAMFPTINANPDYTAIISDRHHQRLTELVAEAEAAGATVLRHRDAPRGNVRRFAPTVVLDPPLDGRLMRDEIFGPVLPVVRTAGTDEAIAFVNKRPRPLALYAYTKDAATERKILDRTISGGVTINSTLMHCAQEDLPFGGVGPSGMGAYHGREGFYQFSHARAIHKVGFFSGFEYLKPPHGAKTRFALKALGIKMPSDGRRGLIKPGPNNSSRWLRGVSETRRVGNGTPPRVLQGDGAVLPVSRETRIVLAFFLAGFSTFSLLYCVQPLLPVLAVHFAVSPAESSLALSLATLSLAGAIAVAAALSDSVGRRGLMFASMAAASAINVAAAFVPDWPMLLVLRGLEGAALGGVPAVAMAYLAEEIPPARLGGAMGLYVGGTAFGGMCGRVGAGILAEAEGWRAALGAVGAIGLVTAWGFAVLLPKPVHFTRQTSFRLRYHAASWLGHARRPQMVLLYAIGFLAMGAFVAIYNYIGFRLVAPPYALNQVQLGLVFMIYLFGVAASPVAGALADRWGRDRVLPAGILVTAAGICLTLLPALPAIVAGLALLTIGFFATHSVASGWVGHSAEGAKGHASSLYLLAYYMGSSMVGSAAGWFLRTDGWTGVVVFTLLVLALALACATQLGTTARQR